VDLPRRGEPGRELAVEHRPVDLALAVAEVAAVTLVRDALTGAVCLDDVGDGAGDPDDHGRERPGIRRVLRVDQHVRVLGRERVPAAVRRRRRVLDLDDRRHRLLLAPLARIPLVDARACREFRGRDALRLRECLVQSEPAPEMDAVELERADRRLEQPLHERVSPLDAACRPAHRNPSPGIA
jgi:hypothetical protein